MWTERRLDEDGDDDVVSEMDSNVESVAVAASHVSYHLDAAK